jgi:fatty acid desaturase
MGADDQPAPAARAGAVTPLLPVQGPDPVVDERIGLRLFCRFGGKGVPVLPDAVAALLRERLYPLLISDLEHDCVFMDRVVLWTCFLLPVWLYLLLVADYNAHPLWFGAVYVAYAAVWFDQFVSYILLLHCVVHRGIFKPHAAGKALRWFTVWVLGSMHGETPETYGAHHVSMHHPTNNGYDDLSTTMTYRRDSPWDFARYLARFFFVQAELWNHLKDRNPVVAQRFAAGELGWLAAAAALMWFRPFASALVFVLPVAIVRLGMICGNWGQHAFINDANPFVNTNQSAVLVNSAYNTVAFNDGYHIQHHEFPIAAYHELPQLFVKMLPDLARNDSVVFDGKGGLGAMFDWTSVWFFLMAGRYDVLAQHFVDCRALVNGTPRRSDAEIIALLKSRTCKVYSPTTTPPPK